MKQTIRQTAMTALFSLCGLLALTTAAEAATYTVDTTSDDAALTACTAAANDCSLRGAIISTNDSTNTADTIDFDQTIFATAQTISITAGVMPAITDSLTMSGTGADKLTIQNARPASVNSRLFNINGVNKTVYLSGMTITGGNVTMGNGGGIIMGSATVTIDRCLITANAAASSGGGISVGSGTLNLINSTVSNNTASGINTDGSSGSGGGGIRSVGTMTITNSTISGNRVTSTNLDNGGGVFVNVTTNGTGTTVSNSTITGNSVGGTSGVGGIRAVSAVTLRNTIVAANVNNANVPDVGGAFVSAGYNLLGNVGAATGFTATGEQTGTSAAPVNPRLDVLANYGGTTPTHRLQTGSPAIDKGSSFGSTSDQRGLTRPSDNPSIINAAGGNGADIGAFELQATPTAASVSLGGRVLAAKGRGLSNAVVYLTDAAGNTQMRPTNNFGYYRFDDVTAGQTVILKVVSKRHQFAPQVVTVLEELTDVNFFAAF